MVGAAECANRLDEEEDEKDITRRAFVQRRVRPPAQVLARFGMFVLIVRVGAPQADGGQNKW